MNKTSLIFGISGQDGSYLANFLLSKDYKVYGSSRDKENSNFNNLEKLGIKNKIQFVTSAVEDFSNVSNIIKESLPDEIYYLAGQSSVALSFEKPAETLNSNILGILNVLEACRLIDKEIRIYYAGSSECFGDTRGLAATEKTPFHPQSPYAVAKTSAFWLVNNYRVAYNLFTCTGILFNHESPLRPKSFVTQKIVLTAHRIANGSDEKLELGRLDISRDWGWAPEYVEVMWLMLQQESSEDFVIATGQTHSLEEFVEEVFTQLGLNWQNHVEINNALMRPTDIAISKADPSKAMQKLNWQAKYKMREVVQMMIEPL